MSSRGDGGRLFRCVICQDFGWVHPRKESGEPDFSKRVPCPCRRSTQLILLGPQENKLVTNK